MRLFVCYVPGLDLRRIGADDTPYLHALMATYSRCTVRTLPSTELVPTLLTGTYPHENGIWQVKLKSNRTPLPNQIVPDLISTTVQCVREFYDYRTEGLAAIPKRRLSQFEIKRFKYVKRMLMQTIVSKIGEATSIFGVVGEEKSRYVFCKRTVNLGSLLNTLCIGDSVLEFLELYSLDLFQHWNLDNSRLVKTFYGYVDGFIEALHNKCLSNGVTLMLLSDHGQEEVKKTIDITGELKKLDISEREYTFFIEVPMARFWFFSNKAREKIVAMLSSLKNGTLLSYTDLHQYNVKFEDESYGEVYFIADPGVIIFPHDFYHPLANIYLGLTDWKQKSRILMPRHRGCHGYLPQYESEKGFMMVLEDGYKAKEEEIDIIDVAPSILGLLGFRRPACMKGSCVYHR